MDRKQCISLIQQAQLKQVDILEISYARELQEISIQKLKKPPYNKREIVESRLKQLIESLLDFGFLGGVYVNSRTRNVIEGWHRCELWQQLGHITVPCHIIDCSPLQEKQLHLKLNQQASIFILEDFGLEFDGLDLVNDFGFSEADLITFDTVMPVKNEKKKPDADGYTKLYTMISVSAYECLKQIKKVRELPTIGDVIEALIVEA